MRADNVVWWYLVLLLVWVSPLSASQDIAIPPSIFKSDSSRPPVAEYWPGSAFHTAVPAAALRHPYWLRNRANWQTWITAPSFISANMRSHEHRARTGHGIHERLLVIVQLLSQVGGKANSQRDQGKQEGLPTLEPLTQPLIRRCFAFVLSAASRLVSNANLRFAGSC